MHVDPAPLTQLFDHTPHHEAEDTLCSMLEEIAGCLDRLQRGLACHDFKQMQAPTRRVVQIAEQIGLIEVSAAAQHVATCLSQSDGVALDATMARLERGFDIAVTQVWDFREI